MLRNVKNIYNTIIFMNQRQILFRAKNEITKRTRKKVQQIEMKNKRKKFKYYTHMKETDCIYFKKNYNNISENTFSMLHDEFTFINGLNYKFKGEINWGIDPFNYRLWTFNLNYFDYLQEFADAYLVTYEKKYLIKGIELVSLWIEQNIKKYDINIWDSYVVSKRVCNWINFISTVKNVTGDNIEMKRINNSIATQGQFILKNIEYYLDCNHVLMNAKALVFSGIYIENENLIYKGLNMLHKEYTRQVFEDGSHYERSPSYQVEVLENYLQCYILLIRNCRQIECEKINLKEKCEKLSEFLFNIMDNNGKIPLLNDSSLDYPFKAQDILQCCAILFNKAYYKMKCEQKLSKYCYKIFGVEGIRLYEKLNFKELESKNKLINSDSGYVIIDDVVNKKNFRIIFDCGDCGPDYNLGHAHADNLNILFIYNNVNILSDAGTYTYKKCDERNQFRATRYHNTIELDNLSSSQVWSAFRVAKRAKSKLITIDEQNDYILITAIHDGYTKVLKKDKIFHERNLIYVKGKGIIIVDKLYGKIASNHKAKINFNIPLKLNKINRTFVEINKSINISSNYDFKIEEGYISEYFNQKQLISKLQGELNINEKKVLITVVNFSIEDINYEVNNEKVIILVNNKKLLEIKEMNK